MTRAPTEAEYERAADIAATTWATYCRVLERERQAVRDLGWSAICRHLEAVSMRFWAGGPSGGD